MTGQLTPHHPSPKNQFRPVLADLIQAAEYDPSLAQFRTLTTAHQYLKLYQLVTDYVGSGSHVLDWGTGNGHFSYFLVRAGYQVSSFGFADRPPLCRALSPADYTFHQGSPDQPVALPYADQTFDAVASVGVLEHVRETGGNEAASLREIGRILKPGGIFLCFHLPNQYSWIEAAARSLGRWSHPYRYTATDIFALTEAAHLQVLDHQRYAILPRNLWGQGWLQGVGSSLQVANLYDGLDDALSGLLSPICQNYWFVAQKRES